MPVVQIELWEGRTDEQKAKLIDAVTDAFTVLGIEKSHVFIVIHETPKANWGIGGARVQNGLANSRYPISISKRYKTPISTSLRANHNNSPLDELHSHGDNNDTDTIF